MGILEEKLESWRRKQAAQAEAAPPAKKQKTTRRQAKPKAAPGSVAPNSAQTAAEKITSPPASRQSSVPLAKQLKSSLDALRAHRAPLTAAELEDLTGFPVPDDTPLADALKRHEKVEFTSTGEYTYKAQHELHGQEDLLAFLTTHNEGVHFEEIKDTYKGIAEDIDKLKAAGRLIAWKHHETEEWVIYPKDNPPRISVDTDLITEWLKQPLPTKPGELEQALKKARIQPAPRKAVRRAPPDQPKERKRRPGYVRKATNTHMPELFQGAQATQID